ncbi:MAG: NADPH-dependent FMN reductase [Sphingobacteriales bacterium]
MHSSNIKNIFAISGSLRAGSSNHNILHFLAKLAPAGVNFTIYDSLAQVPAFDPGLDHESPQEAVAELRSFINHADAVIICTPEYAFGVPGALKNAIDWTVPSSSLVDKPMALITASTSGQNAHDALLLILGAVSANLLKDTTLLIPFIRAKMDGEGNIIDEETAGSLRLLFNSLLTHLQNSR